MKYKEIIVHCSATPDGDDRFDRDWCDKLHKRKGWRAIGYHQYIEVDGTWKEGRPETMSGAHTKGHNKEGLGICHAGYGKFSPDQFGTLRTSVRAAMKKYRIPLANVRCHNEFARKSCPGYKVDVLQKFIKTGSLSVMKDYLTDGVTFTGGKKKTNIKKPKKVVVKKPAVVKKIDNTASIKRRLVKINTYLAEIDKML